MWLSFSTLDERGYLVAQNKVEKKFSDQDHITVTAKNFYINIYGHISETAYWRAPLILSKHSICLQLQGRFVYIAHLNITSVWCRFSIFASAWLALLLGLALVSFLVLFKSWLIRGVQTPSWYHVLLQNVKLKSLWVVLISAGFELRKILALILISACVILCLSSDMSELD